MFLAARTKSLGRPDRIIHFEGDQPPFNVDELIEVVGMLTDEVFRLRNMHLET